MNKYLSDTMFELEKNFLKQLSKKEEGLTVPDNFYTDPAGATFGKRGFGKMIPPKHELQVIRQMV